MNRPKLTPAIIGSVIIFCLAAYGLLSLLGNSTQWIRPNPTFSPSPNVSSSLTPPYHYKESERFSSGERAFFNQSKEPKRDAGINAFKAGNYSEAVTLFNGLFAKFPSLSVAGRG